MITIQSVEKYMNRLYLALGRLNDCEASIIEMFPYPSGFGLHCGHLRNYSYGDVLFRYKRMFSVIPFLRAIGWDAFGLPTENAARSHGISCREWTSKSIGIMKSDLVNLSMLYDWSRELNTSDYNYYYFTQEIFRKFFECGIIYIDYSFVNWDTVDNTTLANEQVIDGCGWRSGTKVVRRLMRTYFFDLSLFIKYIDKQNKHLNWPKGVINVQDNWVGKHVGDIIYFRVLNSDVLLECFTKFPEYLVDARLCIVAIDHKIAIDYIIRHCIKVDYGVDIMIKTDVLVIHPLSNEYLPVYISTVVVSDFGTGAIFCTPNVCLRDEEICEKFGISYSSELVGKFSDYSKDQLVDYMIRNNIIACNVTLYKARKWSISRQRVWGTPIPIMYCTNCGFVPYQDEKVDTARLNATSYNELVKLNLRTLCLKCNRLGSVETDTLDTFFDSAYYYMMYYGSDLVWNIKRMPISYYIGGIEHANLHLIYSRVFYLAMLKTFCGDDVDNASDELILSYKPFHRIITQGIVLNKSYSFKGRYISLDALNELSSTEKCDVVTRMEKMSKSKLNSVKVGALIEKYGASVVRFFILSDFPIDKDFAWDDTKLIPCSKFINKLFSLLNHLSLFLLKSAVIKRKFLYDISTFLNEYLNDSGLQYKFADSVLKAMNDYDHGFINKVIARLYTCFNCVSRLLVTEDIADLDVNYFLSAMLVISYPIVPAICDFICYQTYNFFLYDKQSFVK